MLDDEVWTPQEIANEVGKSRQFVIDVITGKTKQYQLFARKMGRSWIIADDEAKRFINECRSIDETYTPQDIAEAIGMTRKYVLDALTGYGGRKEPKLAGEKRGDRWIVMKKDAEQFISVHKDAR